MSELKDALNSGLKDMVFSEDMKSKVLEECRQAKNATDRKSFRKTFRKTLIPMLICLALCISVTAAAKVLLWNDIVAEKYGVNSKNKVQEGTLNDGLAELVNVSDQNNGITIEVIQTVATVNRLDIYLKVHAKNAEMAKQLTEMAADVDVTFERTKCYSYGVAGSVQSYTEGDDYLIYNLDVDIDDAENGMDGDKIYVKIYDFSPISQENPDTVIEGEWNLSWTIRATDQERSVEFNKEYAIYGKKIKLQKLVLTPTTVQIYLDQELIEEQGIWSANIYATQKTDKEADDSIAGYIDENLYTVEWRAWSGIPLLVYNGWTEKEQKDAVSQIEDGTYQGEYINEEEWLQDGRHKFVDPWQVTDIKMADGTSFYALEDSFTTTQGGIDSCYMIHSSYNGYLMIEDVESIRLGDCVIPLEDGTEK